MPAQQSISTFFQRKPASSPAAPPTREAADSPRRPQKPTPTQRDDSRLPEKKRKEASEPVRHAKTLTATKDEKESGVPDRKRVRLTEFDSRDGSQHDYDHVEKEKKQELHEQFVRRLVNPDSLLLNRPTSDLEKDDSEDSDDSESGKAKGGAGKAKAGSKKGSLTPMERQVLDIKGKHPDTILIVEVGYKFRFFGADAQVASKELGIVCIPGKMRFDEHISESHLSRFASASIPVHRLQVHVKRLVSAGHKVGVVRQFETAALKAAGDNRNAPFVRKLANIYTRGTYIDDADEGIGNVNPSTGYLLCLTETSARGSSDEKAHLGIVAVQPATGDVVYDDFDDGFMRSELETRLLHLSPCELFIVGETSPATEKLVQHLSTTKMNVFDEKVRVERTKKSKSAFAEAHHHLSQFYSTLIEKSSVEDGNSKARILEEVLRFPESITLCLSALIHHMTEYGLEHVFDLTRYFQSFSSHSHMLLNGNTLTNLEIYQNQTDHGMKGSLLWTMDRTKTRFGQRLLRRWVGRPLVDRRRLEERVAAVEELTQPQKIGYVERLKSVLSKVRTDLEKSLIRIYYGKCTRPELLAVLQSLQLISREFYSKNSEPDLEFSSPIIKHSLAELPSIYDDVIDYLNRINGQAARKDDKYTFFRDSHEDDEITEHKLGIASVEDELEKHLPDVAATLGRKNAQYTTTAGIEYLIEVENTPYNLNKVPASWRKISGTKKLSRFHTPEVVALMRERDQRRESLAAACDRAYLSLLADVSSKYQSFRDCVQSLATIDCLISLAALAQQPGYVKPSYTDEVRISVQDGRHPMVEQLLTDSYVPNNTEMSSESRALLVTGPNMGGKSSYVRQIALITIMAQIGSYVPASSATIGLVDSVHTRMGAFDNMLAGESTFMVELSETADILKQATPRSLIILDELGRGTSTHDGVAIAQAVLDYAIREIQCLTLFITHYQNLSAMARLFPPGRLRNVHMRFEEKEKKSASTDQPVKEITFLYDIGEGVAHRSYGLNVARLANVPEPVLNIAAHQSAALESKMGRRKVESIMGFVDRFVSEEEGNDPHLCERLFEGLELL